MTAYRKSFIEQPLGLCFHSGVKINVQYNIICIGGAATAACFVSVFSWRLILILSYFVSFCIIISQQYSLAHIKMGNATYSWYVCLSLLSCGESISVYIQYLVNIIIEIDMHRVKWTNSKWGYFLIKITHQTNLARKTGEQKMIELISQPTRKIGRKWTGKKFIENMMTTAINIFATFRLVRSWLSKFRFTFGVDADVNGWLILGVDRDMPWASTVKM